jgi:leucyl/phenylalanyl-tRNA--protein transferase
MRSGKFQITINQVFKQVMLGCADREDGTWITSDMLRAYCKLHRLGHAHSVETWHNGELVGGVYGVSIGGLFAGESMFHRMSDASKVALVFLACHLKKQGYTLFDTQMLTEHTERMGAVEISRPVYLNRLRTAICKPVTFTKPSSLGSCETAMDSIDGRINLHTDSSVESG